MQNRLLAFVLAYGVLAACQSVSALAQEESQDVIDPAVSRRIWLQPKGPAASFVAPPYTLTKADQDKFPGTFGIDLSHYSFDIKNGDAKCKTSGGYSDPACSCTINWQGVETNALLYVYSKASDGKGVDLSFPRLWADLESKHTAHLLYRGAFHFLRPGVSAAAQASAFLGAIGAIDGKKPPQLPPVLDIEWSSMPITPGTPAFDACLPASFRTEDKQTGTWVCDMWYQMPSADIAALAQDWIKLVQDATGRPVIIYTNPTGWWNSVMKTAGADLVKNHAIWTSRYTADGPQYDPTWTVQNGSPKWKMAPIPEGAAWPQASYSVANFWQFSEHGHLPSSMFMCVGKPEDREMDLNWLPVDKASYPSLFGVGGP